MLQVQAVAGTPIGGLGGGGTTTFDRIAKFFKQLQQ